MLLTPMSRMVGVSSKITEDGKRKALKETGRAIAQERFGLVMRTAAENAPEEELAAEAERLFQQWEQIRRADRACAVRLDAAAKHARSRAG